MLYSRIERKLPISSQDNSPYPTIEAQTGIELSHLFNASIRNSRNTISVDTATKGKGYCWFGGEAFWADKGVAVVGKGLDL